MSNEDTVGRFPTLPFGVEWLSIPIAVALAGGIVLFAPLPTEMARMLAITGICVCLWIATPVTPWFTSLFGIGLIGITFSTELALVGFNSPALWLVVLGVLIGEAMRASGLASLIEQVVLGRVPERYRGNARDTYRFLLVVLCVAALCLAFVVPSALVRVLILAPILVTIGEFFDSREATLGLFFGPLFATFYGGTGILTGSIVNIIISGIVDSAAEQTITWTGWLVQMGPVMSLGRVIVVVAVTYCLYRPPPSGSVSLPDDSVERIWDEERRMVLILLAGVVVWATDFLHGLHPLYGALLVVLLAFLPRIGVSDFEAIRGADFTIVFFIGAIFAIAEGLTRVGVTEAAAQLTFGQLPRDASFLVVLVVVAGVCLALLFLMEGLAVASVLTPILITFAQQADLALVPIMMMEAVALSTYFFPYQSAVLVAILSQDVATPRELIRMASVTSIATIVVLYPLQIGWFFLLN